MAPRAAIDFSGLDARRLRQVGNQSQMEQVAVTKQDVDATLLILRLLFIGDSIGLGSEAR